MNGDTRRWVLTVLGLAAVVVTVAAVPATAQSGGPVGYHGDVETEDGTPIPNGTTLIAVANGSVQDRIDVSPSGQYGTADPTGPKLFVNTDETVSFYVEKEDGTRIEALTTADPTKAEGAEELNITFPTGTVASAPYFAVSDLQPEDGTAMEGETVEVSATLSNNVDSGTQSITFAVDGQTQASKDVTLATGESKTVNFTLDTTAVGTGSHTYTIASANESKSETLTVTEAKADFTVFALDPVEQTVLESDPINASATVTNDGNAEGTQTVTLEAGGTTLASSDVTLAAGDEQTVSFSDVSTDALAPGRYTYGVYTDNGSQTGTLTVESRQATFTVSGLNPTGETLTVGDEFSTSATVSNNGNTEGTQTISFQVGGTQYGSESVTLAPDEEQTLSFGPVNTTEFGPGSYSFEVGSANDSQTGTLVVESDDPATFTVTDLRPTDTTVVAGQSFDVEAAIRNDGDQSATQQVQFRLDGNTVDRDGVTLESGELATVSFTDIGTSSLEPGTYTYGAYTANDSRTGTLTVEANDSESGEETPSFTVSAVEPAGTAVTAGTDITVSATITNDGAVEGTQGIRLFVDAETVQSESVTLAPAAETTVSLTVDTASLSVGSHVYRVVTDDDQQAESFSVTADSQSTPRPTSVTATPPETQPTTTATPPGTLSETAPETPAETTQSTTTESEDGGGGLLPSGLLGTVILWVGVPLLVIYGILKAMAIYLGY